MQIIAGGREDRMTSLERTTVLIVDDSSTIRESLKSILKSHDDMEVVGTADEGYEAVAKAMTLRPDIILMDAQMPVMDGASATRIIKEKFPEIRILFMTVHANHIDDAREAGADGFMMKDIGREEVLRHIRTLTGRTYPVC